jgi:hypothetical protein
MGFPCDLPHPDDLREEELTREHGERTNTPMKTIKLEDELHRQVKARAALRGVPLSCIVEAALLDWLGNDDKPLDKPVQKGKHEHLSGL